MHSIQSDMLSEGLSGLPSGLRNFGVQVAAAGLDRRWDDRANWLLPAERPGLAHAVNRRRREIIAGRLLARALLDRLGGEPAPIRQRRDRCPDWPAGIVGSITHTDTVCAVALCKTDQAFALGVDLEPRAPLPRDIWKLVCRPEELEVALQSTTPALWTRWMFSAKEAFYKAQYPLTGIFMEPLDIAVQVDPSGKTYRVACSGPAPDDRELQRCLSGQGLLSSSSHLLGAAWVVAADTERNPGRPFL